MLYSFTPFTVRTQVGAVRDLNAPLTQSGGYQFASWSDGGAASHSIAIAASAQTLSATYVRTAPAPGSYRLRAEHSSKCLEHRGAAQRWRLQPSGTRWTLQKAGSGKCLEVHAASTADGAAYVQASCANAASQRFDLAAP